jgi:hypothetical protein
MWVPFRRRKRKELTYIDVAGCTPEERLDMSMIAVELGKMALAMTGSTRKQRQNVRNMLDEARATIDDLRAKGVEPPKPNSPRAHKIASHISKTVNRPPWLA